MVVWGGRLVLISVCGWPVCWVSCRACLRYRVPVWCGVVQCGIFTGMDPRAKSKYIPEEIKSGIKVVFWYAYRFSKTQKETHTLLSASCLLAVDVRRPPWIEVETSRHSFIELGPEPPTLVSGARRSRGVVLSHHHHHNHNQCFAARRRGWVCAPCFTCKLYM